jgi:hypothetical protein
VPDRLAVLQRIADLALCVRTLERELIPATDTRKVVDLLTRARAELDEALEDLVALDRSR